MSSLDCKPPASIEVGVDVSDSNNLRQDVDTQQEDVGPRLRGHCVTEYVDDLEGIASGIVCWIVNIWCQHSDSREPLPLLDEG